MLTATIPEEEHTNIMGSFWTMMLELESKANNDDDRLLKHFVEGYFRQWNLIMKDNKEPVWVRRSKA